MDKYSFYLWILFANLLMWFVYYPIHMDNAIDSNRSRLFHFIQVMAGLTIFPFAYILMYTSLMWSKETTLSKTKDLILTAVVFFFTLGISLIVCIWTWVKAGNSKNFDELPFIYLCVWIIHFTGFFFKYFDLWNYMKRKKISCNSKAAYKSPA